MANLFSIDHSSGGKSGSTTNRKAGYGLRLRTWRARWIWAEGDGLEKNVYYYFRKTLDMPGPTDGLRLFIAADTRYQLFINGLFIGRGAPQSQPFYQYYDEYDIGSILSSGENVIAALVYHSGDAPDTRGGLRVEVENGQGERILCTDGSWKVLRAAAWTADTHFSRAHRVAPYQEFFDARKEPEGWQTEVFNDERWPEATPIGEISADWSIPFGPWAKTVPRDIPRMSNTPVFPVRIECIEENLDLLTRTRPGNLSPGLSMAGNPIRYTRMENPESLCGEQGVTQAGSSTNHLDREFDGVYAPAVVLDFGRVITARTRLHLDGAAGDAVDIGYAERLIDGRFNISIECEQADHYVLKEGEQVFESFTWKAFRYLKLRFHTGVIPIAVRSVQAVISTFPYEERGAFESDDPVLNAVFDLSRYTLRLCSNDCLMDTPWREQAQWLGDTSLVTVPAIHSCFGDEVLSRKFFMQSGRNQHPTGMVSNISNTVSHNWLRAIPDFSLWWIHGLLEQYLYTGDEAVLCRLYPQVLRVLDAHLDHINQDGLVEEMPYWVFIDWADIDHRGISGPYNAIFYSALERLQRLAEFREDTYTVNLVNELRKPLKEAFHRTLFDAHRGLYADASLDGTLSKKVSEHGNMAPIWAGLCDTATEAGVIDRVFPAGEKGSCTEAQPFFMTVVLGALERADRFDLAVELIRQRWGQRMVGQGALSAFEEWYQNGSWRSGRFEGFLRSHSHAWSACPADFLIRGLMGVEILEPGCRKIHIRPRCMPFDYRVEFPTPLGSIRIEQQNGIVNWSADSRILLKVSESVFPGTDGFPA